MVEATAELLRGTIWGGDEVWDDEADPDFLATEYEAVDSEAEFGGEAEEGEIETLRCMLGSVSLFG